KYAQMDRCPHRASPWSAQPPFALEVAPPAAETQPRCGVTRDGVKRLQDTREPPARQAPDGRTEGGTQSPDSSRSNRRLFLAPPLSMAHVTKRTAPCRQSAANLYPALDIGSHINVRPQPLPEAGATQERTLEAVACMPWLASPMPPYD